MCLTDAPFRHCVAESVSLRTAAKAQGSPDKHQKKNILLYTMNIRNKDHSCNNRTEKELLFWVSAVQLANVEPRGHNLILTSNTYENNWENVVLVLETVQ